MALHERSGETSSASAKPQRAVDNAIQHICKVTNSQHIQLLNKDHPEDVERSALPRYIVPDIPYGWDLWRPGDDVNLYFLTADSEKRWAEVIAEALEIDVGSKDLKEASKDGSLDLTDDRVCRFKNGQRNRFWHLKHADPAKARIVLHYCKTPPSSWFPNGSNLSAALQHAGSASLPPLPDDTPRTLPLKAYVRLQHFHVNSNPAYSPFQQHVRMSYPHARAWAEANDLWKPHLIGPHELWLAVCAAWTADTVFDVSDAEEAFIDGILVCWADTQLAPPLFLQEKCWSAVRTAALASIRDLEGTRAAVRAALAASSVAESRDELATASASRSQISPGPPSAKFRDARSALNRLRHDPAHTGIDYDVGYLDRFEGIRWMALSKWGAKGTEEEDFVPEHRVRTITRVRDAKVVWDREGRVDLTGGA